jgi:hypothetical protein
VAGLLNLGTFVSTAGQNSGTNPFTSNMVSAGAVGSATQASAGSNISSTNLGLFVTPTITGGTTSGGNGANGLWNPKPMFGLGGAGGGGNSTGTGGNGGNGGYGCGGGGGGMGNGLGGNGGKGGDGLVIIATF